MKVYSVAASVISIFAISTAYFVEKGLAASDHLAPEQQRTDFIKNVRQDALISQIHWFIGVTDVELINEGLDRCKSFREGTPLSFYYHLAFQQAVPFSSGLPGITPQRELIVSRRSLEHLCPDQAFKLKYPRALTPKVLDPGSDKFFNSLWNPQESASSAQQQEYVKQIRSDLITMKVSMSPAFLGEKSLISFA